jgi:hypothetical protein
MTEGALSSARIERLLKLAEEIRRHQQEVIRLKVEFCRLLNPDEERPVVRDSLSLAKRIQALLEASALAMTAIQVRERLGGNDPIETIRTTLWKLNANALIVRHGRGLYGAVAASSSRT